MKKRLVLQADEGKILTNGELYGSEIFLAEGEYGEDFWEIPKAEYEKIMEEEENEYIE